MALEHVGCVSLQQLHGPAAERTVTCMREKDYQSSPRANTVTAYLGGILCICFVFTATYVLLFYMTNISVQPHSTTRGIVTAHTAFSSTCQRTNNFMLCRYSRLQVSDPVPDKVSVNSQRSVSCVKHAHILFSACRLSSVECFETNPKR